MKFRIFNVILFLILGLNSLCFSGDRSKDIENAKELYNKGLITATQFETYSKEIQVDTRELDFSVFDVFYTYKLDAYGLMEDTRNGYKLADQVTRLEAYRMFIYFTGAHKQLTPGSFSHPFTDVPEGANDYIGYLYQKELLEINGNKLNPDSPVKYKEYTKIVLRELGYKEGVDYGEEKFNREVPRMGFPPIPTANKALIRKNIIEINYNALNKSLKGKAKLYRMKLAEEGHLKQAAFDFLNRQGYNTHFRKVQDVNTEVWLISRCMIFLEWIYSRARQQLQRIRRQVPAGRAPPFFRISSREHPSTNSITI